MCPEGGTGIDPIRLAVDAREALAPDGARGGSQALRPRTGIGRYLANLLEGLEAHGGVVDGREIEPILLGGGTLFDFGGAARAAARAGASAFYSPYYKVPLGLGIPALATVHDLIPMTFAWPRRALFRARLAHALHAAARVVTVSETTRERLLEIGVPPERIVLSPNAVSHGLSPLRGPRDAETLKRWGLASGGFVLSVIDRRAYKNLAGLLAAWEKVGTDIPLAVTTTGETAPRVRFLGRVTEEEMAVLYRSARLLVHPSFDEGFGLPVLEAMASGTPVAASRAGAVPEVGGPSAAYFDPQDATEIARVVTELLDDDPRRARMRTDGLARAALSSPARLSLSFWRAVIEAAG